MKSSRNLEYLPDKSASALEELWQNCFAGPANQAHMNAYVPQPITKAWELYGFLKANRGYTCWLIRHKNSQKIIGFAVHGDFIPGQPNSIGFNIGLPWIRKGYAKETLRTLLDHLRQIGYTHTQAFCFANNTPCIRTLQSAGFEGPEATGERHGGVEEWRFWVGEG